MHDRTYRVTFVTMILAELLKLDVDKSERAALLAKADLTTGVVGEFPELQGVMGRYYALHDGEDAEVAEAIRDHYRPLGPSDVAPTAPVSIAVALADKIDSLTALWRAGEKPTGSKDPFALRRAALGIIRIVLENKLRLELLTPIFAVLNADKPHRGRSWEERIDDALSDHLLIKGIADDLLETTKAARQKNDADGKIADEILAFMADRLKVALKEKGTRHDLIDAIFSLGGEDDLVRLTARVEALQAFLKSDDGVNLLAGYKRAANILRIEEKKDSRVFSGEPDPALLQAPEEKALFAAMATANDLIKAELQRERFKDAMTVLAGLRAPVDAFFDKVTVNAAESNLRENRLMLLAQIVATAHGVADFSKIEG